MSKQSVLTGHGVLSLLAVVLIGLLTACSSPEQRAQAHYESGQTYLQNNEYVKAGLEFRNAVKYNDKLVPAWQGLAKVEEHAKNWQGVATALKRVAELDAKDVDARIKLAKLQFAAIDLQAALKTANEAYDLRAEDTDILALRGAILLRLGDREAARRDAEAALAINPDNADALGVLAADQMVDNKNTAALQFIERGLKTAPENLGLLLFKIKILDEQKNLPELETVLRQVIAANPEAKQFRQALVALLSSQSRFKEVEAEMREMVKADPKDTTQALDLVRFVNAQRGADEARAELQGLIHDRPAVIDFKLALAELDYGNGKKDEAAAQLNALASDDMEMADANRLKLLLASFSLRDGNRDKALELANEVLAKDQRNADALGFRASLKLKTNDIDGAVADLREALAQTPKSVQLLALIGQAFERQGSIQLAAERYLEAVKISGHAPDRVVQYVEFLKRRDRADQVMGVLEDAIALHPNDGRLLAMLSREKLARQDWVGAQKIAEALKDSKKASDVGEQLLGAALLGQSKYDEGIALLKGAYEDAPTDALPLQNLVYAYFRANRLSDAENFLTSVLSANPRNADALVMMGALRIIQKRPQDAEDSFKHAMTQRPDSAVGYYALAQFYRGQNRLKESEDAFRQGVEHAPGNLGLSLGLGQILEANGDIEGAIAVYEKQLKTTPDAMIVINNLASLLVDYRSDDASLEQAAQLARSLESVDVPHFHDTLGWVAYRRGDYQTALTNLEEAAAKLPDMALVKYHLAMTYAALDRKADAKKQLEDLLATMKDGDPIKPRVNDAYSKLAMSD